MKKGHVRQRARSILVSIFVLPALAAAGPALTQSIGQGTNEAVPWLRLGAALLLCIGLAVGAAFAVRYRMGGAPRRFDGLNLKVWLKGLSSAAIGKSEGRLTDVETCQLSPQVSVSTFKCDGQSFMVATSSQGHLVLVSLEADAEEKNA